MYGSHPAAKTRHRTPASRTRVASPHQGTVPANALDRRITLHQLLGDVPIRNPTSQPFISLSKHTNFENRTKSAESRAPEINGPIGEERAGFADLKSGVQMKNPAATGLNCQQVRAEIAGPSAKLAERDRFERAVRFCSVARDFCLRGDWVAIPDKQKAAPSDFLNLCCITASYLVAGIGFEPMTFRL
jgi:hypothetical protein